MRPASPMRARADWLSKSVKRFFRRSPSIGGVTRVYRGELPYLKSWLLHYKRIGISHFYLIHTREDPSTEADILSIARSCDITFSLLAKAKNATTESCFDKFIPEFEDDYLLHVDVDEFLLLEGAATIPEYVQVHPAQYYRFQWVVCPYDGDERPAHLSGSLFSAYKSMASTALIRGIAAHTMTCEGGDTLVTHEGSGLLHYWGRSFTDILIKCLHGYELGPEKNSSLQELSACAISGRLPNRLKMLALVSRRATADVCRPYFVERDAEWELRLVAELAPRQRSELFDSYCRYRDALSDEVVRRSVGRRLLDYVSEMP